MKGYLGEFESLSNKKKRDVINEKFFQALVEIYNLKEQSGIRGEERYVGKLGPYKMIVSYIDEPLYYFSIKLKPTDDNHYGYVGAITRFSMFPEWEIRGEMAPREYGFGCYEEMIRDLVQYANEKYSYSLKQGA